MDGYFCEILEFEALLLYFCEVDHIILLLILLYLLEIQLARQQRLNFHILFLQQDRILQIIRAAVSRVADLKVVRIVRVCGEGEYAGFEVVAVRDALALVARILPLALLYLEGEGGVLAVGDLVVDDEEVQGLAGEVDGV